ncbi:2-isopropylmalate synthase [Halolactibacillus halophilus]|uniref:2-isopropylmalate synthase n=1 Tax=Halolactibacillus halophilus TaxID=306540 RepID=A0A1I5N8L2_9BACI|nr:2-isopropylmalate synthase [Halolactibacillus halophilus]GEM01190.1 2-isopropylmalate synthase [Halolactibacillus halophilus]SFP18047.1 2-isopropylmalate synthase [Halolactibacillus halophilus]
MTTIKIFDTTLRDGEQSPGVNLNNLEKLEIAKQLERLGVDVMEAGFPASSQGDFDAVKKIADTISSSTVAALARANKHDIDRAWDAIKGAEKPRIHVFIATSPIHMQDKLKKTPEEVIDIAVNMVSYAKSKCDDIEFSAEDASRSELPFLADIIEKVITAGATVINLPDTVGYTTPKEYGAMFKYMKAHVKNIDQVDLSTHCHDDLGMALINSIAGVENGATQVEGTINGIGERAGNVALEEMAVTFEIRKDFYPFETNLILNEIKRTSDIISKLTGMVVPGNKSVVGRNAFAHESGIHQDGVLKNAQTYEIITPELVGVTSNSLVLGKHSGRHAFKDKIKQLGFSLDDDKTAVAFDQFKQLTDRKKEVTDDDLFVILMDVQTDIKARLQYQLKNFKVEYNSSTSPTATVSLITPGLNTIEGQGTGNGSVEALYNTIEELIEEEIQLTDFTLSSVGKGKDALAEVHVSMTVDSQPVSGRATAQDVLEASLNAFINAINRVFIIQVAEKE